MIQSMSRKGNCWDNAPMESCFGTLKTELVHQACYPTRDTARHDLFAYIEGYYNRQRLHSAIGYIKARNDPASHRATGGMVRWRTVANVLSRRSTPGTIRGSGTSWLK